MRKHAYTLAPALVVLAVVASVVAAQPALARPVRTLTASGRVPYVQQAGPVRPATLNKAMDVPMGTGGILRGYIPAGKYDVYHVPMYSGQNLVAHWNHGPSSSGWELALFNLKIQDDALQYVVDGGERLWINYDATKEPFSFYYDLVVFAGPWGGSYEIVWDAGDPVPYSEWVSRINGSSRYSTAAMGAAAFHSPSTVVVATGVGFPDALAASALCGSYDAPLLLTSPKALSPEVKSILDYERPERVFVIGSSSTIPDAVLDAMKATGRTVERIAGKDRFATAAEIAKRVHDHEIELDRDPSSAALVVSGKNYPDALAASPYAFSARMPVLLVKPDVLPTSTQDAIATLGIDDAHILGGEATVSQAVMDALPTAAKDRIAGADRCDTSSKVASYAVEAGWADWGNVALATGYNFPDGLAAGVCVGKQHGVVLLTKPLSMTQETYTSIFDNRAALTAGGPDKGTLRLWGSPSTLSGFVFGECMDAITGVIW